MPYKLTGTLIALLFYGLILNSFPMILSPSPAVAQMAELTEIQNGIFFLSQKNMGITSETFLTDKYIDEDQARYFSDLSRPALNTPADGNYPFTLVDHYILDSDLEIEYHYDAILCSAYPQTAYLSRHDISITDYTDAKVPPVYSINEIRGRDPFTDEKVTAMHLEVHNYESYTDEILQKAPKTNQFGMKDPQGAEYVRGYVGNTYVRVDSAQVAVWIRKSDTELMERCNPPIQNTSCLHPSDLRPIKTWYIIRTGNIGPFRTGCEQEPPLLPRDKCYYSKEPERDSAAATNWSYNNNLRNASSTTSSHFNVTRNSDYSDSGSSCPTCR